MAYKLGKLNPDRAFKIASLSDHMDRAATWPGVPAIGWEYSRVALANGLLDNLGNDVAGNCVIACAHHQAVADSAAAGKPLKAIRELCLKDYSAITGYDPSQTDADGNNPTDNGTTYAQLFAYWKSTGMTLVDVSTGAEVKHKILGAAALDLSSVPQQRYAAYVFGGNLAGIQLPSKWIDNLKNWNDPSGPVAGGHGVPFQSEGSVGWHANSWGNEIPGTWDASRVVVDEMYVVVSEYFVNASGKSPTGIDMEGLLAAMKAL